MYLFQALRLRRWSFGGDWRYVRVGSNVNYIGKHRLAQRGVRLFWAQLENGLHFLYERLRQRYEKTILNDRNTEVLPRKQHSRTFRIESHTKRISSPSRGDASGSVESVWLFRKTNGVHVRCGVKYIVKNQEGEIVSQGSSDEVLVEDNSFYFTLLMRDRFQSRRRVPFASPDGQIPRASRVTESMEKICSNHPAKITPNYNSSS